MTRAGRIVCREARKQNGPFPYFTLIGVRIGELARDKNNASRKHTTRTMPVKKKKKKDAPTFSRGSVRIRMSRLSVFPRLR
jgi:hypothetical protein